MIYVDVKKVSKKLNNNKVIHQVSLQIEQGSTIGIIGNNGSGKTVLLKMICGLYLPSEGTISIKGKVIGKDIEFPDDIGFIIETPGFNPSYSGYRNLKLLADIKKKIRKEEIKEVIRLVGLDPDSKKHVGKYSLGMKQRLGLAQAIMEDPEILVLDEPFNGLDKDGVAEMREMLLQLKAKGKTILIASHLADDIEILCDKVYEMEQGKCRQVGSEIDEEDDKGQE